MHTSLACQAIQPLSCRQIIIVPACQQFTCACCCAQHAVCGDRADAHIAICRRVACATLWSSNKWSEWMRAGCRHSCLWRLQHSRPTPCQQTTAFQRQACRASAWFNRQVSSTSCSVMPPMVYGRVSCCLERHQWCAICIMHGACLK